MAGFGIKKKRIFPPAEIFRGHSPPSNFLIWPPAWEMGNHWGRMLRLIHFSNQISKRARAEALLYCENFFAILDILLQTSFLTPHEKIWKGKGDPPLLLILLRFLTEDKWPRSQEAATRPERGRTLYFIFRRFSEPLNFYYIFSPLPVSAIREGGEKERMGEE